MGRNVGQSSPLMWTSIRDVLKGKLDKNTHANLFNGTVLPALLYGSRTWVTTKIEEQRLVTSQRAVQTPMLGVSLRGTSSTNTEGRSSEGGRTRRSVHRQPVYSRFSPVVSLGTEDATRKTAETVDRRAEDDVWGSWMREARSRE